MRWPWPRSLAAQLIVLLLLALVAIQAVTIFIYLNERSSAVRTATRTQVLSRVAGMVRVLAQTPERMHPRLVRSASGRRVQVWLSKSPVVESGTERHARFEAALNELLQQHPGAIRVTLKDAGERPYQRLRDMWRERTRADRPERRKPRVERERRERWRDLRAPLPGPPPDRQFLDLSIAIEYEPARWLNVVTVLPVVKPVWAPGTLVAAGVTAVLIVIIVVLVVRRATRATRALASAAHAFGRGEHVGELPETGPEEVRVATRAFNDMREQLTRFVQSRTRMLAAISHDLRTPLTALRVRAELIDDDDNRERMLDAIEEMMTMVDSTLEFARVADDAEPTRAVDITALADSVCEDLRDVGANVQFKQAPPYIAECRPLSLKRAIRNLVQNAVTHAGGAEVSVASRNDVFAIIVEDNGPGIPLDSLDKVLDPFVRLETSRSRDTGGVGMGLAIAASVARAHGGDLKLANRAEGGLRATLELPPVASGTG